MRYIISLHVAIAIANTQTQWRRCIQWIWVIGCNRRKDRVREQNTWAVHPNPVIHSNYGTTEPLTPAVDAYVHKKSNKIESASNVKRVEIPYITTSVSHIWRFSTSGGIYYY